MLLTKKNRNYISILKPKPQSMLDEALRILKETALKNQPFLLHFLILRFDHLMYN